VRSEGHNTSQTRANQNALVERSSSLVFFCVRIDTNQRNGRAIADEHNLRYYTSLGSLEVLRFGTQEDSPAKDRINTESWRTTTTKHAAVCSPQARAPLTYAFQVRGLAIVRQQRRAHGVVKTRTTVRVCKASSACWQEQL
jgi:hypothetical protein